MKKILFAAFAALALCSCSGEREYLDYKGLSMGLPAGQFLDSLKARGFEVDTLHSDGDLTVFTHPKESFTLAVAKDTLGIVAIQETYTATYNDSTRQLWQTLRDKYADELDMMPGVPHHGDDHKEAIFDTRKGAITVLLQNTYTPTLIVKFDRDSKLTE